MKLSELLKNVKTTEEKGETNIEISGITIDSKSVKEGDLFICIKGLSYDGHDFIKEAERRGAVAVVAEKTVETKLVCINVQNTRVAMPIIASEFYGNPCKDLKMIGVTGTNGKTTTTNLIKKILEADGKPCAIIGTLGTFFAGKHLDTALTTPDPIELYKTLAEIVKAGIKYVVMEVSAHSVALGKIDGIKFEVGVFTNFTQDHLDYFGTMEKYKEAKLAFLTDKYCKKIVVNSDDEVGASLISENENVVSYGIDNPADVFAINVKEKLSGIEFVLNLLDKIYDIRLALVGRFNVYNALAAAVSAALLGVSADKVAEGLMLAEVVPGRLELVSEKNGVYIFVDYAHTPDGLENSLKSLRNVTGGRLISVFGCGGNRDKSKRSIMGEISGKLADFTIITSDNPRFEEPMYIISEIEKGVMKRTDNYVIVQSRGEAINYAINYAKSGDAILLAGKGAETYQEILGIKHAFNDKEIVNDILEGRYTD